MEFSAQHTLLWAFLFASLILSLHLIISKTSNRLSSTYFRKKLRIVSMRQLQSEEFYLSPWEFVSWELLRFCAVVSRSASLQMSHFTRRSMRCYLQQQQRREFLELFVFWLLTINSDAALVSSAFRNNTCSNFTSRWLLFVRPFGKLKNFLLHASPASNDSSS